MKYIILVILFILCFALVGCHQREDDEYLLLEIELTDAFIFDNNKEYVVGDTLYFELNFSRYLKEDGYANLLDVYETTGATKFYYSFRLSKYSELSNRYTSIQVASEFIFAQKGEIESGYNEVYSVLNEEQTHYESRIGIVLAESGNFDFGDNYNSIHMSPINVDEDHVYFGVSHVLNDDPDKYKFTVVE